jgi:hypothetical protein
MLVCGLSVDRSFSSHFSGGDIDIGIVFVSMSKISLFLNRILNTLLVLWIQYVRTVVNASF